MTLGRRDMFLDNYRSGELFELADYLSMDHPLSRLSEAMSEIVRRAETLEGTRGTTRVTALSGEQAEALIGQADVDPVAYYSFTRGFIDYLNTRGGSGVLANIASNQADGVTFADWLAGSGSDYGLPSTIESLTTDWSIWLEELT